MKSVTYVCDTCAKVKGDTNHWFGVRLHRNLGSIVVIAFDKIPAEEMEQFDHVCGAGCLLKRVDAMVVAL